jgi:hypothetical protein
LRQEIDWYARNRKLAESEGDGFVDTEPANCDEAEDDSSNDDSMENQFVEKGGNANVAGTECDNEEFAVEWNFDHNFFELEEDYGPNVAAVMDRLSDQYDTVVENRTGQSRGERPMVTAAQMERFNDEQILARDTIVRAATGLTMEEIERKLIILIGLGGTGKSTTVNAVITTLKQEHGWSDENYAVWATTGMAATNIHGSTVHSWKEGLGFPDEKMVKFMPLGATKLIEMQDRYKDKLRLVILDEYSMLHQKQLYYMDARLKQIMCSTEPFGGVTIVLTGDPGQLPPVGSNSLWVRKASNVLPNDLAGYLLYQLFRTVIKLEENVRIDPNDPDAVLFNGFQIRLRNGLVTKEDVVLVRRLCSRHSMTAKQWKDRGFDDPNVPHSFCTNDEVSNHNARRITDLGTPIASIRASHTGRGGSAGRDKARGLFASMYLAVGSKVQVNQNLATYVGICNGSTGIVKDIVYEEGVPPPGLPRFVIVDFGDQYMGESFFPDNPDRRGWVPIKPVTSIWTSPNSKNGEGFQESSRTMLPMVTAWAFTIWKSQGQTFFGNVVLHLSEREKEHGLTYVAFSRATRFSNIGLFDGITETRIIDKIRDHSKMRERIQHELHLDRLYQETKIWMSTPPPVANNL